MSSTRNTAVVVFSDISYVLYSTSDGGWQYNLTLNAGRPDLVRSVGRSGGCLVLLRGKFFPTSFGDLESVADIVARIERDHFSFDE